MSEEVIKVLEYLGEKFGIVVDWTSENVMPYAEDLIHRMSTYNIVLNSIWSAIGVVLLVITVAILIWCFKQKRKDEYWGFLDEGGAATITMLITGTIGITLVGCFLPALIESIFIPEIAIMKILGG